MPTRTLTRIEVFDLITIYANNIASQSGWENGSFDDIENIIWNNNDRNIKVIKKKENTANGFIQRHLTFSTTEIYNLVKNLSGWSGGTSADILSVEHDKAGQKIKIIKVAETY